MRSFEEILDIAAERKGDRAIVLDGIEPPLSADELAAIPDDRWLAQMTKAVFQAGFSWKVIETKWPGFETAFFSFDVDRAAFMAPDWFDELVGDTRIVRNAMKIRSVHENAMLVQQTSREVGGFGRKIADWPGTDFAGLLRWLAKNGSRMGGTSAQYFLRSMGKDSFILSRDVVGRLVAEGVIDKPPTSQKAMASVQSAFNTWTAESGQSLKVVSRVLAQSTG
ncbi:MAG: DNA-3-methyladenine glycosylase I [Pseudomonadota bacterium]